MLEAPAMLVSFFGSAAHSGPAEGSDAATASAAASGRVRRITAGDGVRLSEGSNAIRALKAVFDVEANEAQFTGDVRMTGADGRTISARLASIDTSSRRVVLTGNVVATQTDSLLRGNRLIYEPNDGRMRLASPAVAGSPSGDIFVRFKPPARRGRRRQQAAGNAAFATNPDAPIEITARSMDVQDLKSVARFTGRVRARQGDLVLTTPLLTADYTGRIGLYAPAEGKAGRQPAMKLRLIRASRPVTVTSGADTKATGETAEFDVVGDKVTLAGNVVLERGRQIVRGDRLVIDLKTGLSRMLNAPSAGKTAKRLTFGPAPRITANPGQRDCGGQMCAVFYPMDARRQRDERKGRDAAAAARKRRAPQLERGWSSSTTTN
jgi:lipopolysaccharide transport protein LptA